MCTHDLVDLLEVVVLDMPTILAQVHRNAVGTGPLRQMGRFRRTRIRRATRLPKRGNVVYVDAEKYWGFITHSYYLFSGLAQFYSDAPPAAPYGS